MASSSALFSKEVGSSSFARQTHKPAVNADSTFLQSKAWTVSLAKPRIAKGKLESASFPEGLRIGTTGIPGRRVLAQAADQVEGQTEAEREGWEKRMEESKEAGTDSNAIGGWKWTLNWDFITPDIAVGSCPRSASDVDRIVNEGGFDAIVNLQSNLCFDALEIPIDAIRRQAIERGVLLRRVPVRDFDHSDQALMLPEAVRALNLLVTRGKKVYVHCTAGINRATLTVVGYLTFVRGLGLDEAVTVVKTARPVAHPYIDCWQTVRKRFLEGRDEQLTGMSRQIYDDRCSVGAHGNMSTDWRDAQTRLIAETFQRYLEVDQLACELERDIAERGLGAQEPATSAMVEQPATSPNVEKPAPSAKAGAPTASAKVEKPATSAKAGKPATSAKAKKTATSAKAASSSNGNGAAHVPLEEEEADDSEALECNVITRECVQADAAEVDEWESTSGSKAKARGATI